MSTSASSSAMTEIDLDDWTEDDEDDGLDRLTLVIDGRRQVENKLEELRLARELGDYNFDF